VGSGKWEVGRFDSSPPTTHVPLKMGALSGSHFHSALEAPSIPCKSWGMYQI
jgi:hypothetical protein